MVIGSELVSDGEAPGAELDEPSGLDTGVSVLVVIGVAEDWLETDTVLLGTPEEELTVTIVEEAVELPVPGGITGREDECLIVLDGVRLGSLTGREVL